MRCHSVEMAQTHRSSDGTPPIGATPGHLSLYTCTIHTCPWGPVSMYLHRTHLHLGTCPYVPALYMPALGDLPPRYLQYTHLCLGTCPYIPAPYTPAPGDQPLCACTIHTCTWGPAPMYLHCTHLPLGTCPYIRAPYILVLGDLPQMYLHYTHLHLGICPLHTCTIYTYTWGPHPLHTHTRYTCSCGHPPHLLKLYIPAPVEAVPSRTIWSQELALREESAICVTR